MTESSAKAGRRNNRKENAHLVRKNILLFVLFGGRHLKNRAIRTRKFLHGFLRSEKVRANDWGGGRKGRERGNIGHGAKEGVAYRPVPNQRKATSSGKHVFQRMSPTKAADVGDWRKGAWGGGGYRKGDALLVCGGGSLWSVGGDMDRGGHHIPISRVQVLPLGGGGASRL